MEEGINELRCHHYELRQIILQRGIERGILFGGNFKVLLELRVHKFHDGEHRGKVEGPYLEEILLVCKGLLLLVSQLC